jgi:UPF0755 protein
MTAWPAEAGEEAEARPLAEEGASVEAQAGCELAAEEGASVGPGAEDGGGADARPGELGTGEGVGQELAPPRNRRRRWVRALAGALALALAAGVVGFFHISAEINPPGRPGKLVKVVIPSGTSTLGIARLLARAGVIHGPDVFEIYLKLGGGGPLLAGTYYLRTNESYSSVIAELERPPVVATRKLVVPEGFTVRQIAERVGRLGVGISARAFLAAALHGQVRSPYEPAGTDDLEGLLFPATYDVPVGEDADELVQWMVDTFDLHAGQLGLSEAAKELHYTPYQVVTVASIVEREAKLEADRGPIASAIYNRLARRMPIGAESTLLYGLGNPSHPVNVLAPDPYNTLLHKGLPPTPISNPGVASLLAAMHPPRTSYLYWVEVKPDGKMGFASSYAEFRRLEQECRAARLC